MCGTFHHDARFDVALQLQIVQQPTHRECIAKYYEITAIHVYWLDCNVISMLPQIPAYLLASRQLLYGI